jgi:malonyl-CoA O-methyltransferase
MLDKDFIRRSFSKAAPGYEANSDVQKEVGLNLARLMARREGGVGPGRGGAETRILDIGCGTGALLRSIKGVWPGVALFGCDIALPMLREARSFSVVSHGGLSHGPGCEPDRLLGADCEALPFRGSSFDMCVSNLAYQWAPDIGRAFKEAGRVLRPGGLLYFTTLGPGTLGELRASYEEAAKKNGFKLTASEIHPYRDARSLKSDLEAAGLEVMWMETSPVKKTHKNLWALLKRLKSIGAGSRASGGANTLAKGALLKEAARAYRAGFPSPAGGIIATYEVIYALAGKPRMATSEN